MTFTCFGGPALTVRSSLLTAQCAVGDSLGSRVADPRMETDTSGQVVSSGVTATGPCIFDSGSDRERTTTDTRPQPLG